MSPVPLTSPQSMVGGDKIKLTETEEKIFQQLIDVVQHHNLATQLRVAGGWVRDKLLGRECYDIDIALDDMYGKQFCEKIQEYLGVEANERGFCVIQSNPDQSKHLETARMSIFNMMIDFVNLRSEKYSDDSRIPEMEFGSPKDDALRRDLTINSLFYNISTMSIEDYTGRGLSDLRQGVIVTPLSAKSTFLEDPLRVLRAVRFGARFDFAMDKEIKAAAADILVKTALKDKISRERIGHEIDLMIGGNEPVKAISWIQEFELFWIVFTPPNDTEPAIPENSDRACVTYMKVAWDVLQSIGYSTFSTEERKLCLYGGLFLPLRDSVFTDKKSKKLPVSSHIFRNSLKLKISDADTVAAMHETSEGFSHLLDSLKSGWVSRIVETDVSDEFADASPDVKKRISVGLLLRKIKKFWRIALLISTLVHPTSEDFQSDCSQVESKVEMFKRAEKLIAGELNMDNIWETKPLLNGNAIMEILGVKGKQIGEWQQRLLKWQLANPHGNADDCHQWLLQSNAKRTKLS